MTETALTWLAIGVVGTGVACVWVIFDRRRSRRATEQYENKMQALKEEHKRHLERGKQELALTCRRCNKLAVPIIDTSNRYRCEGCGNQFAGARHGLRSWTY